MPLLQTRVGKAKSRCKSKLIFFFRHLWSTCQAESATLPRKRHAVSIPPGCSPGLRGRFRIQKGIDGLHGAVFGCERFDSSRPTSCVFSFNFDQNFSKVRNHTSQKGLARWISFQCLAGRSLDLGIARFVPDHRGFHHRIIGSGVSDRAIRCGSDDWTIRGVLISWVHTGSF